MPMDTKKTDALSPGPFETHYPNIAEWLALDGLVEIGPDGYLRSFVRALDEGGMIWEGEEEYPTLDDALRDLDTGVKTWMDENLSKRHE